ncbi:MAG: helix-turn-helix domain-containing protein [Spirochaetes bacterium]|nr:helix-turn-helix domain-containing protein [Spirochaetota bacterium]
MILRTLLYVVIGCCIFVISMAFRGLPGREDVWNGSRVSLEGTWKISLNDDPRYADPVFDDSEWDDVSLPSNLMHYVYKKTDSIHGVLWIRKKVRMGNEVRGDDLGLILGRIANADDTYFNGIKIGGMGRFSPHAHSMWNHPRHYRISNEFVRHGRDNVIAVRISYFLFGDVMGNLAITGIDEWSESAMASRFLVVEFVYMIMALGVILFIIYLFFSIKRPAEQEYLYYCLQLLCGFFIVLELCSYWDLYGSQLRRQQVLVTSWVALTAVHPIFLHRVYGLVRKKTEAALWAYFIVVALFNVFFIHEGMHGEIVRIVGAVLTTLACLVGMYNISCHVSALIKKHPYAKLFSFFGIIAIMGALHDGGIFLMKLIGHDMARWGIAFQYMIFPYAAAVFFIGSALVLTLRFIRMMDEVEDLNTSLESFVIENALLNKKLKATSALHKRRNGADNGMGNLRSRILNVVEYINENYTARLSRSFLADQADVHPDSLSRLFKKYTGKKLGDYINELRMREAADKLIRDEENVMKIASSVGFDSIRTFNRLFPRYMGTTPERYRRDNRNEEDAGEYSESREESPA